MPFFCFGSLPFQILAAPLESIRIFIYQTEQTHVKQTWHFSFFEVVLNKHDTSVSLKLFNWQNYESRDIFRTNPVKRLRWIFIRRKFANFSRWLFRKDLNPRCLADFWMQLLSQSWCPFIICIITYFSYLDPR